ncbi:class I SAM-dependent methyltransferase [Ketobacter sp. MCCC 1A13808]|uniref:class I SAM-dependent methyltransferase n=1 Tax=Ketobacter sp. MCCC 1A13808 TaxID=2602738 RepID=UPI0012EBE331|nr:class I SAM-dependent methyltransferase [Ketobacter sp. MCCC 1A13808]MVF11184.1 class I SAM-dependent methyltransferase [Ketobacter sp. MCCC 1A13808]
MEKNYRYQKNLSLQSPILLNAEYKKAKVDKMISVLLDAGALGLKDSVAVDIGCSIGFFAKSLAPYFDTVYGLDIDEYALNMARESPIDNVIFNFADSMRLPFENSSIDLVVCNHVYEHVPDPSRLFMEIKRVLKPEGICYFGAASSLTIIEPHHHLLFLSWLPKRIANKYMKIMGKGGDYYENLFTYWGLKKLISEFHVEDYTLKVIRDPDRFNMRDMIPKNSLLDKTPIWVWKLFYQLLPSYIFVLRVKNNG